MPTKVQIAVSVAMHTAPITCPPTMLAARLPDLSRVRVPFYMALTRFYAMLTERDTEASYSFLLEEAAQLDVFLTSDFVTAGLGLLLQYGAVKQPTVVAGEYLLQPGASLRRVSQGQLHAQNPHPQAPRGLRLVCALRV